MSRNIPHIAERKGVFPETVTRGYGVLENFLARQRTAVANRLIPAEMRKGRVLDVGCGESPFFLMHTEFRERYGLDQTVDAGTIERYRGQGITLSSHDLHGERQAPFPDGYFDVVTMLAVIEHIEPLRAPGLVRELYRLLRPGGRLVLTTPAAWSDKLLRTMASLRLVSPREIEEHKAAYTPSALRTLIAEAQFPPEHIRTGYFELYLNLWAAAEKGE